MKMNYCKLQHYVQDATLFLYCLLMIALINTPYLSIMKVKHFFLLITFGPAHIKRFFSEIWG